MLEDLLSILVPAIIWGVVAALVIYITGKDRHGIR